MKRAPALLIALALAAAACALGPRAYQSHLDDATGRAGTKRVSCLHCHSRVKEPPILDGSPLPGPAYLDPEGLAASPDGRFLFVAAARAGLLLEVDLSAGLVSRSVPVAGRPHGVAVSADGRVLAVTARDADRIALLDAGTLEPRGQVEALAEPLGVALSRDGKTVFAAEGAADSILVARTGASRGASHLAAGREPCAVALSKDGRRLVAVARMPDRAAARGVPVSELTVVDAAQGRVAERRALVSAVLGEGAAVSADGSFALAPVLRVRNLLPTTEVARGGLMNSALVFADLRPGGRTVQFPLDEADRCYADPSGVALTPDGRTAFVAHAGADAVSVVDAAELRRLAGSLAPADLSALEDDLGASGGYVRGRIPTGPAPRGLALSSDASRLFVSERLSDSVAEIDVRSLRLVRRIDLGGPKTLTAERRGDRRFHDASSAFQGQFSCRSCHPDGGSDGLTWDFEIDGLGREVVQNRSLRGVRGTAPFKWNGKNPTLARQCGPRFSRVLMRADPFPPDELADLVAYMESIPRWPRRAPADTADAVERGKALFRRTRTNAGREIAKGDRCATCHPPPLYTARLPFDVGTGGVYDAPHLLGTGSLGPYLHDGRASTLEEIWTVHNPGDAHGVTNDMTKAQLNDLISYLRSL